MMSETSPSAEGIAPVRRDPFRLPKPGLVLQGGGMRGLFTAGVLDALHGMGVRFGGIIGVSAGAAFGCRSWKLPIGRLSRSRRAVQADYDIGRETAVRRQAALRDWMDARPPEPKKAEQTRASLGD